MSKKVPVPNKYEIEQNSDESVEIENDRRNLLVSQEDLSVDLDDNENNLLQAKMSQKLNTQKVPVFNPSQSILDDVNQKQTTKLQPNKSGAPNDNERPQTNMNATVSRWATLSKDPTKETDIQLKRPTSSSGKELFAATELVTQNNAKGAKVDEQLPVEYEAAPAWQNRLKTMKQFAAQEDAKTKPIRPMSTVEEKKKADEAGDDVETQDSFSNFRFKSFRTHKLIEEDYSLLELDDPEEVPMIISKEIMNENRLNKDGVELVAIDAKQLARKEAEKRMVEQQEEKERIRKMREDVSFIAQTEKETSDYLVMRRKELELFLHKKQQRSRDEFMVKKTVLESSFGDTLTRLVESIKRQKDIIIKAYGPLMLQSKRQDPPLYQVSKELDPQGYKWIQELNTAQTKIPQTLLVKVRTVRCLKDKVASGHYLVIVHALDRLGGNRIIFDHQKTEGYYKVISKNLREFAQKKRAFLNQENRHEEVLNRDGTVSYKKALQTGEGFFRKQQGLAASPDDHRDDHDLESASGSAFSALISESDIDLNQHLLIDFERTYTKYTRFNGRSVDENLNFDDSISVLVPPICQTTNVLLFQLILLESESVPKDYCVGWGAFPLLNSDFEHNEGKFKVPLLFGNVDPQIDRFEVIEDKIMDDLDNWTANLYFEIERVKLVDLKLESKSDRLFYKPVTGQTAQELQQMVKYDSKEDIEERSKQDLHNKQSNSDLHSIAQGGRSTEEDEYSDSSTDSADLSAEDEDEHEEKLAEQVANLVYNNNRDQTDINYDHYMFSVAQKFDFSTRNLTYKKFKYIADEVFLDLKWRQRHTIQFKVSILIIIFLFFLRILIHYIGQYIILQIMGVPVTGYTPYWHRVQLTYASWQFIQDFFLVATGAIANTLIFILLVAISLCSEKYCCKCFPKYWYKVICWVGIYAVLDPPLTFFFDTISQEWDSDFYKFYNYFYKTEGSGLTGIYITIITIVSIMMFSGYCFYRFMVFTYMQGRILDLYRRLSGNYKDFFIPHDNEISLKYLQWVLDRYRKKNCIIMSELRTLKDKFGVDRNINFIQVYNVETGGEIKKNRLFFKDFDGSIIEVPQRKVTLVTHELKKLRKEHTLGGASLYGNDYRSLNQVVKSTYKKIKTLDRGDNNQSMDGADLENLALAKKGSRGEGLEAAGGLAGLLRAQKKEREAAGKLNNEQYDDSAKKGLLIDTTTLQTQFN